MLDSMQSYTSICRLELGRSPGSDLLLLLVSQVAFNLGLCSSGPIAYGVTLKEVVDDFEHDGRRNRNSRTALGNISYRCLCQSQTLSQTKGLPAKGIYAPADGSERKVGRCAQSQKVVVRLLKLLRRQVDEK